MGLRDSRKRSTVWHSWHSSTVNGYGNEEDFVFLYLFPCARASLFIGQSPLHFLVNTSHEVLERKDEVAMSYLLAISDDA